MKPICRGIGVLLICFCFSCAPGKGGGWLFRQPSPQELLFQAAETKYQEKSYDDALLLYRKHLSRFPKSPMTPAVLLKMGLIGSARGNYTRAEGYFERVIRNYPDSVYARKAGVEMLAALYLEGKYQQVTLYAKKVPIADLSREQVVRVNMMIGDAYLALRSPLDAYNAFLRAYQKAKSKDRPLIVLRLKTVIALMPPEDIQKELERLKEKPPAGYLMYQQGLNDFQAGHIEDAVTVLTAFIDKFPRHENIKQAEKMLAELASADLYARNVIGCLLPLSGKYETFGQQALKGIELALETFATRNHDNSVKILVRDTASEPQTAQNAVQELSDSHVAAIIGPLATSAEAALKAQSLRLPIITLTQKPHVTDIGEYVFRNFLTPRMQMEALVGYAARDLNLKRFAVLYPDERYGETFMNLFWDEVINAGGRVVGVEAYNPEHTDFADPIKKLVGLYYEIPEDLVERKPESPLPLNEPASVNESPNPLYPEPDAEGWLDETIESAQADEMAAGQAILEEKPEEEKKPEPVIDFDAVFIPDSADKVGLILPQLAYYDIKDVYLLGTNLWHSEKLIQMARFHAQGAILTEGFFDQAREEQVSRFVDDFKRIYGASPGFIEAVSFDTAMILFTLAGRPDVRYRTVLKQKLLTMEAFDGVTGRTRFAQNGEALKDIYLLRISKGKFRELNYIRPPITGFLNGSSSSPAR